MKQPYAELTLCLVQGEWKLYTCPVDFLEMTGLSRQILELEYQDRFLALLAPDDHDDAHALFSGACAPTLSSQVYSLLCQDGPMPILFQLLSSLTPDGQIRLGIHDATAFTAQITRLERRVQSLEESVPSGLCQFLFDDTFTVIWHNSRFLDILGYTEEQFALELQSEATSYIHPEDTPVVLQLLNEAIAQGKTSFLIELRICRRDGAIRYLLTSFSFTGETAHDFPVLYSAGIDITDQRRTRELEADAQRLRWVMDQASSYIMEYDISRHRLLTSERLKAQFGLSHDLEHMPESLIESGIVVPASADAVRTLFRDIEEGNDCAEAVLCLRQLDHEERWFRIQLTANQNDLNPPQKASILAEDITDHHNMEIRYQEEEQRRAALTYDMNFSCQMDLTTGNIVTASEEKFPFFVSNKPISAREFIRRNAAYSVHPEDRSSYLKVFCSDYILAQFQLGIPEISLDFRSMNSNGESHWCQGVAHIICEPVQGHIFVYIYTKNIEVEKQQELELRRHAEQDSLTGLLNRYTTELSCDRLLETISSHSLSVMYMMDLDHFKYLNDTYGHLRGDEMLQATAAMLRTIFGDTVLLGRLGGDELVALQPDCPSHEDAEHMAERICQSVRGLSAGAGVVSISVGLAFAPKDGRTFSDLYHCADDALHHAKRAGKDGWSVYRNVGQDHLYMDRLPVSREWLLEESSDIIYVCDFYSYDILYMNKGARHSFQIEADQYIGRKCYELLQQKDHPCEFCTNHLLCHEKFHTWEFRNRTLGKSLLLRDRIVDWYGVPARIEFATDISSIDSRNQALEAQVEIDHTIIACLRVLNSAKSLDAAASAMLAHVAEFYAADRVFILDYAMDCELLFSRYEWTREGLRSSLQLIGVDGLPPYPQLLLCFQNRESFMFDRLNNPNAQTTPYLRMLYDAGITCQRCVPFYVGGQVTGLIGVDNPNVYRDELTVLETLSYFISEELSRSRLSESLAFLSYHDSLTGLSNRNRYVEYLESMKPELIQTMGVAVADLNALSEINRLRGHSQGDLVVKRTADLLRECFPNAYIFRLSGDEFVIHSEDQPRAAFHQQASQVRVLSTRLQAHGISVGYAWTDRDIDCTQLTSQAMDLMMLQKREYYQQETQAGRSGRHDYSVLQKLMRNLQRGYFQMYLQPKACCGDFSLSGAEALVRFESPKTGLISPDRFISMLEQEHVIQYVDLFMFEEVCKLLARWQAEGRTLFTVSLNFSRQTVLEPELLVTLLSLTDRYGVPKDRIEVEVTESLGEYDPTTIAEIGNSIKSAGFRLALDDFGSHYTNMAMLSAVPADVLKLDRSLVQDVMFSRSNQLVLKSVLSLCHELGISSIAEGVETQEQYELLCTLECDDIQGYLFGRPTTVSDFELQYLPDLEVAPAALL